MIKRMHVAVNCSDLQKSLDFYKAFSEKILPK